MKTTPLGEEAFQWFENSGVSATFSDRVEAASAYSIDSDGISILVHEVLRNESADVLSTMLVFCLCSDYRYWACGRSAKLWKSAFKD